MSSRIRGQEVTLELIVDGQLQNGSFMKVVDWNLTPDIDINSTDFLGETASDHDIMFHGFSFNFTVETLDSKAQELLDTIIERELTRLPHPAINLVVMKKFRSLTEATRVDVYENVVMKMDDESAGSRKDYVKTKWSGKCKQREKM